MTYPFWPGFPRSVSLRASPGQRPAWWTRYKTATLRASRRLARLRIMRCLSALLGTLAVIGCQLRESSPIGPPPDPPSGEIRTDAPISYDTLAEHLRFNPKSRMRLTRLCGRLVQVHGPVYKVEDTVIHLGTEKGSYVRANFPTTEAANGLWEGQEVDLVGTLAFRG